MIEKLKELSEMSMKELRAAYPSIKAVKKVDFISLVEADAGKAKSESDEVDMSKTSEFSEDDKTFTWYNILGYLEAISTSRKKVLIKCGSTMEADLIWARVKDELYPILEEQNIGVMSSSSRRDNHFNGTCYVRFVCKENFEHLKSIFAYSDSKELI